MSPDFEAAVRRVVAEENCSGCGACALLSSRVTMELDAEGFARPVFDAEGVDSPDALERFGRSCPGRRVPAPPREGQEHPVLGRFVSAWQGWAADPETRLAGSSGGVLTALATWLVDSGRVDSIAGAGPGARTTTVPVRITTREEALASSGSRYAPVGVAASAGLGGRDAIIAKPCEASAVRQLAERSEGPVILTFFCAGTPSQLSTDRLVRTLGADPERVSEVRYRGNGWPGRFVARTGDSEVSTTYEQSWGDHLGRDLQWRCKICGDGLGDHGDIAVGDYWHASADGYPVFEDEPGRSVVLARSRRGEELLMAALRDGAVVLEPVDLDAAARVQPLQEERKRMLGARLLGRALAGRAVPRYPGYRFALRSLSSPVRALRNLVGTFRRSIRGRP